MQPNNEKQPQKSAWKKESNVLLWLWITAQPLHQELPPMDMNLLCCIGDMQSFPNLLLFQAFKSKTVPKTEKCNQRQKMGNLPPGLLETLALKGCNWHPPLESDLGYWDYDWSAQALEHAGTQPLLCILRHTYGASTALQQCDKYTG